MCGNSICQDRRFLAADDAARSRRIFHYRNLDVSTLKELARRWKPELLDAFKKARRTRRWPTSTSRSTSSRTTASTFLSCTAAGDSRAAKPRTGA